MCLTFVYVKREFVCERAWHARVTCVRDVRACDVCVTCEACVHVCLAAPELARMSGLGEGVAPNDKYDDGCNDGYDGDADGCSCDSDDTDGCTTDNHTNDYTMNVPMSVPTIGSTRQLRVCLRR